MNSGSEEKEEDRSFLGEVIDSSISIIQDPEESQDPNNVWSLEEIKEMLRDIQSSDNEDKTYLHEMFANCQVVLPTLTIPERNPELQKRIIKLQNQMVNQEYKKMTQNVNLTSKFNPEDTIGFQLKQMNKELILVFQLLISLAAAFMFGFMGFEVLIGRSFDLAVNILWGIMFAVIVGAAEVYFIAINVK